VRPFAVRARLPNIPQIVRDATTQVLVRGPKMCNFVEWREYKLVYRRYASLYFCVGCDPDDNELLALEAIHLYVEILDRYFGSVCELGAWPGWGGQWS